MIEHPTVAARLADWRKWRLCFEGGDVFVAEYLKRFTSRETLEEFYARQEITPSAAHAKSAILEIKNSIFGRIADVYRMNGSTTYREAIAGKDGGVDLNGHSMNSFIGSFILPECLVMGKVGIYVDMPPVFGPTLADTGNVRPYLYWYRCEDILNWSFNRKRQLISLYLRDTVTQYDEESWLVKGEVKGYRHLLLESNGVLVTIFDQDRKEISTQLLNLPRIPFHVVDIGQSLMEDIASYQIAILNLNSSDVSYALQSNFPFYVEQSDNRAKSAYWKDGNSDESEPAREIEIGINKGRTYPPNFERPSFIHPSSEPLDISIKKQDELKNDIRRIVHLAVSSMSPKYNSADSKKMDNQGLEAGLSAIGLALEHAENEIAKIWALYEGTEPAEVIYPKQYSLKSDEERNKEAETWKKMLTTVPSRTYQREVKKQIATTLLGNKVSDETLKRIHEEIDKDLGVTADMDEIAKEIEYGTLSPDTACLLRGHNEDEIGKANVAHAERLRRIQEAQTPKEVNMAARGIPDADPEFKSSAKREKEESRNGDTDPTPGQNVRGKGKKTGE